MKLWSMILILLVPIVMFAGCLSDDSNEDEAGTGTIRVLITDAPGDYDEVNITFDEISIHKSSDGEEKIAAELPDQAGNADADTTEDGDDSDNGDEGEAGWSIISTETQTVDLLELTNGITEELGIKELEEGHYTQIRLFVVEAETVIDSISYDVFVPSSVLKLNRPFDITEGIETTLVVDFDAERSIHKTGAGQYILRPTVRVIQENLSGRIVGTVTNADSATAAYAIADGDTTTTAYPDTTGAFLLGFLPEGDYLVSIENGEGLTYEESGVAVSNGSTNDLGAITLE